MLLSSDDYSRKEGALEATHITLTVYYEENTSSWKARGELSTRGSRIQ